MILEITESIVKDIDIVRDYTTYFDNIESVAFHSNENSLIADIKFGPKNVNHVSGSDCVIKKEIKRNSSVVLMSDYGYAISKFNY